MVLIFQYQINSDIRILITTLQNQQNVPLHIISIQEAWLTEERLLHEMEIANYEMIYEYKKIGGPKGGIVILICPRISFVF